MPKSTIQTARRSLTLARGLISGAAVSLEHVLSREADDAMSGALEQQAEFILGELEHAIVQIRGASAVVAELNAPVVAVVEAARAAA